eukprot:3220211-Rhodomonas_salina.1
MVTRRGWSEDRKPLPSNGQRQCYPRLRLSLSLSPERSLPFSPGPSLFRSFCLSQAFDVSPAQHTDSLKPV